MAAKRAEGVHGKPGEGTRLGSDALKIEYKNGVVEVSISTMPIERAIFRAPHDEGEIQFRINKRIEICRATQQNQDGLSDSKIATTIRDWNQELVARINLMLAANNVQGGELSHELDADLGTLVDKMLLSLLENRLQTPGELRARYERKTAERTALAKQEAEQRTADDATATAILDAIEATPTPKKKPEGRPITDEEKNAMAAIDARSRGATGAAQEAANLYNAE